MTQCSFWEFVGRARGPSVWEARRGCSPAVLSRKHFRWFAPCTRASPTRLRQLPLNHTEIIGAHGAECLPPGLACSVSLSEPCAVLLNGGWGCLSNYWVKEEQVPCLGPPSSCPLLWEPPPHPLEQCSFSALKGTSQKWYLEPQTGTLLGIRVFAVVIMVKISKWDHPGLAWP